MTPFLLPFLLGLSTGNPTPIETNFSLALNLSSAIPSANLYVATNGVDSSGCGMTPASACATPNQASTNLRPLITPTENFTVALAGGTYHQTSMWTLNSQDSPSGIGSVTYLGYNGVPIISGARDIGGTWSGPVTLPAPNTSGVQACVSNAMASMSLVDSSSASNSAFYFGKAWFFGHAVQEPIVPRIGQAPDVIDPTNSPGTAEPQTSTITTPTATFTSGTNTIGISDMSQIGPTGSTIGFRTTVAGFGDAQIYWIVARTAGVTGSGTVTLSSISAGSPQTPNANGTSSLEDQTLSTGEGERISQITGINTFPVGGDVVSSVNQGDVKVWLTISPGSSPSLLPVATASSTSVTLAAHPSVYNGTSRRIWAGIPIRHWNRYEDLGTGGFTSELYVDRTGAIAGPFGNVPTIYYVPRSGETCAGLNAPGASLIPTNLVTLLRLSTSAADGSVAGNPVQNINFQNISFQGTNTTILSGARTATGISAGVVGGGDSALFGVGDYAVEMVGVNNITMTNFSIMHTGEGALGVAWGSSHSAFRNFVISDVGVQGITTGINLMQEDNFHFQTAPGYLGNSFFGPTTKAYNGLVPDPTIPSQLRDPTGNFDCCNTFQNGSVSNVGTVYNGAQCMDMAGWQQDVVENILFSDCPGGASQEDHDGLVTAGAPGFNGTFTLAGLPAGGGGVVSIPVFGNIEINNIGQYIGFEMNALGQRVGGSDIKSDYGLYYWRGPQDGDGSGATLTGLPLTFSGNIGHDVSGSCYPVVNANNGAVSVRPLDAKLLYTDGNNGNGYLISDNLFYNSDPTVSGSIPNLAPGASACPNSFTGLSGGLRTVLQDNIFAGTFPEISGTPQAIFTNYRPRGDQVPLNYQPQRNTAYGCSSGSPCYMINQGWVYQSIVSGTTGATAASLPVLGGSATDGTVLWTGAQELPTNNALSAGYAGGLTETHNITAWVTTGATGPGWPQVANSFPGYPQFIHVDHSVYYQAGQTMTFYSNNGVSMPFSTWFTIPEDAGTQTSGGVNCNPGFADITGASGVAGFQPTSTCGLAGGYTWPGFATAGPQGAIGPH